VPQDAAAGQILEHWIATDRKAALRVFGLMKAARRDPFRGIGKPEPRRTLPDAS
jgi:toxin YoeB